MGGANRLTSAMLRAAAAVAACALMAAAVSRPYAAPAAAQGPTTSVTINQLDAGSYPDLTAVVTVIDASGKPAPGLDATSFSAADGSDSVDVLTAQRVLDTSLSLGVVVVIDVSGSMEGAPLASAKAAASEFVGQLDPGDRASVVAFSDTVRTVVPFTDDRAALAAGIQGLTAGGATSLYEAVRASAFAAGLSLTPRTAIVVLSDGENDTTTSTATEASSLDAVRGLSIPVYAIGYGSGADPAYLGRLADATRGQYFAAGAADVSGVYATIADQLRGQYALTLRATRPEDGAEGALVLTAEVGGERVSSAPAAFTRGVAAAPTIEPTEPAPVADTSDEGGSSTALPLVLGAVLAVAAVLGVVFFMARAARERRRQREREKHAGQQTDEPLPAPLPGAPIPQLEEHPAQLVEVGGEGGAVRIGPLPVVIGSDAQADVRVAQAADIAPRHAQVWMRDGKIMLRHVGGQKKTTVQGKAVDWMILEEGDEFSVGLHRYRIEGAGDPSGAAGPGN